MKLYTLGGSRYGSRCLIQMSAKVLDIPVEIRPHPLPPDVAATNPLAWFRCLMSMANISSNPGLSVNTSNIWGNGPSLLPQDSVQRAKMRLLIRLFELYYELRLAYVADLSFSCRARRGTQRHDTGRVRRGKTCAEFDRKLSSGQAICSGSQP